MRISVPTFFALITTIFSLPGVSRSEEGSLQNQLQAMKEKFATMAPESKKKAYAEGIESVAKSGVVGKAVKTGGLAPDFSLKNSLGDAVSLKGALAKGPVVLMWYRGGWCPYCNLQLRAMQSILPEIEAAGAQLIALTPELPDKSLSTREKNELKFEVLTDIDQKVARAYGLVFKLTPEVAELYAENFDLKEFNGKEAPRDELPLAATYVIGQDGKVAWHFLDADYRKRAEPAEVLAALEGIK